MRFPRSLPALLAELVAIPSVSPEGDSGGTVPGEAAIAAYVADLLRAIGADVEIREVEPGRPNVVGRVAARRRHAPTVALVPHLDTVGVSGMSVPPFVATVRQGRLYGRGACDTKGPMAAALWALRASARDGRAREINVVFVATMGEEELSAGASALCRSGFKADFAIALEPTGLRVVHAAKGVLRLWAESAGVAAHGATPERGRNAIYGAASFLTACRDRLGPEFARTVHPLLGRASLNVGIIDGGIQLNVVPARCRVGLDIRTHPYLDAREAQRRVARAATGMKIKVHRAGPAFVIDRSNPWAASLAAVGRGYMTVPWFSDANVLNAHGIPAVAFGPGSIAQAHTANEFIGLAQLEAGGRALEQFLGAPVVREMVSEMASGRGR